MHLKRWDIKWGSKMQWVKLGDYIDSYKERSGNTKAIVSGVDINKQFIATRANLEEVDVSKYYKVPPMHFACNLMHIGRDERIPIALNKTNNVLVVTSAYYVFRVKSDKLNELSPEYLYVFFNTPEKDRLTWFYTDSSVRGNLTENRFKDIEIPLPSIDEQKQVVAAWRGLKNLGEQNEQMAGPLMDLCQSYIERLYKTYELKDIGDYFTKRDERNYENKFKNIKGLTVYKKFIETKADMDGVSLSNYKIVYPGDIAYVSTTNRNGDRLACGLCEETCIVSTIYDVLKIDTSRMLPEYLFLWFARSEMDRYARYNSWGSAREVINYEDLCRYKIPVPPIEIQRAIVEIYNCARTAQYIADNAKQLSNEACPALIRQIIGDNK